MRDFSRQLLRLSVLLAVVVTIFTRAQAQQHPLCPRFLTHSDSTTDSTSLAYIILNRGYKAGDNERATIALLGRPLRRVVDTVTNRYDSTQIDTLVTLRYRGIEVGFYKRSADAGEILSNVGLSTPHCEVSRGLSIDARSEVLTQVFGAAAYQSTRGDTLLLQFEASTDGPVSSYLDFTVVRGWIRKIEWQFGID